MATQAEIEKLYTDILGRAPDPAGLEFWKNSGQSAADIAKQFKATPEAQVAAIYQNVLGRAPDAAGSAYWQQQLAQPGGLFGAYTDIKNTPEALARQNVTGIYQDVLGRAPDVAGKEFWEKQLADGKSIAEVKNAIRQSAENTVPNRPSFDDVFSRWNEEHKAKYGKYYNTALVNQDQFDTQIKSLADRTKEEQKAWDEKYGKTQEAQIMKQAPPPNWYDIYAKYDQDHRAAFGKGINRAWNADDDARRTKEELDKQYLDQLSTYNQRYGTNIQPDAGVLGTNTQPNTIFQMPEQKKKSLIQTLAPYAGLALSFAIPGAGAALGSLAGLSGISASIAGNAVIGGAVSGLAGGNVLQGAVLGGVGGAISGADWGSIGDSLSSTFADITGLDTAAVKSYFSSFSQPGNAATLAAEDAANLASQGLGTAAIQQNLIASGIDSLTAATLANNAVMPGSTVGSLLSSISGQPIYTNVAGLLSGGDAFATTQSVFDKLVTGGMSPTDAAQIINTAGGGLNLGTVGLDSTGKLVETAVGAGGSLLTGAATAGGAATAAGTAASTVGKALAGVAGTVGGQVGSGLLSGVAGVGGALADKAALERYAQQIRDAANQYAPQQQFQPVGVTTRFGRTTTPQYDAQGRLTNIGYQASGDIAAQRDRLLSLSGEALPTTTNTQQATQQYYDQLQALQRPTDELTLAQLQNRLQATGRGGLAFGATSGMGGSNALMATNPELAAYYNALSQRQAQQSLTAQDVAQQRLAQQIATSGTLFGQAKELENVAQQPLQLSSQFGQQATAGSTNVARSQLEAAGLAARLQSQGALGVNSAATGAAAGVAPAIGNILGTAIGNLF